MSADDTLATGLPAHLGGHAAGGLPAGSSGLRGLAKGQRSMASWDADSATTAVDAGRQLQYSLPGTAAGELALACTTLPLADRLNAGIVAAALGLDTGAVLRDVASSVRAALTMLAAALCRRDQAAAHLVLAVACDITDYAAVTAAVASLAPVNGALLSSRQDGPQGLDLLDDEIEERRDSRCSA